MGKKILLLLVPAALLAGCVTGCVTAPASGGTTVKPPLVSVATNGIVSVLGNEVDPKAAQSAVNLLATGAVRAAVAYDTNCVAYLRAAVVVLNTALADKNYDPATLNTALSNISVNGLRNPKVAEILNPALSFYSLFYGKVGSAQIADVSPYLVPALTGLRDGIAAALPAN